MFDENEYRNQQDKQSQQQELQNQQQMQAMPQEQQDPGREAYAATSQQPKKMKGSGRMAVAIALACALVGGIAGGGAVYLASGSDSDTATMQAEETTAEDTDSSASKATTTNATALNVVSGSDNTTELTASEVYAQNVDAVVGINTETTTNYFGQASSTASSGSGFIITEDGYVVTNAHVVVEDDVVADTVTVVLTSGDSYVAEIVGYDTDNDVALLKIDATGLQTVTIGDSDTLEVGEMVCAIGNPLGELTNTLTVGYVSALDREINTDGTPINMLQTDCAINPGNSGGPLFDMYGNVIGITTSKYTSSSSTTLEGLGFALPINDVMEIVEDLQQYGYVTGKAYLGISLQDLSVTMASYYNLPVGVYVNSVTEGSCAETAGIQAGDIITALGDTTIQTYTELSAAMREYSAGDTTTITVYRNSEYIELTVTFDEKVPDTVTQDAEDNSTSDTTNDQGDPSGGYSDIFGSNSGMPGTGTTTDTEENSGNAV